MSKAQQGTTTQAATEQKGGKEGGGESVKVAPEKKTPVDAKVAATPVKAENNAGAGGKESKASTQQGATSSPKGTNQTKMAPDDTEKGDKMLNKAGSHDVKETAVKEPQKGEKAPSSNKNSAPPPNSAKADSLILEWGAELTPTSHTIKLRAEPGGIYDKVLRDVVRRFVEGRRVGAVLRCELRCTAKRTVAEKVLLPKGCSGDVIDELGVDGLLYQLIEPVVVSDIDALLSCAAFASGDLWLIVLNSKDAKKELYLANIGGTKLFAELFDRLWRASPTAMHLTDCSVLGCVDREGAEGMLFWRLPDSCAAPATAPGTAPLDDATTEAERVRFRESVSAACKASGIRVEQTVFKAL